MKRPGVDDFLIEMAKYFEIVLYTSSNDYYADKVLEQLDTNNVIRSRLYFESCVYYSGRFIKDLSLLGRDLSQTVIVDDEPGAYSFQPENAIDIKVYGTEEEFSSDRELEQIAAFLKGIKDVPDVRGILKNWRDWQNTNIT
jgi:carboxy-terminal domain RNA polymerase II polypeptide A small phosphatase